MKPILNVLISTIDSGINNIKNLLLDVREDVSYIISHQYTKEAFKKIPSELDREDIIISQVPGKGVTRSRNNAIRMAQSEIGLFSDDDVTYTHEYFDKIIALFSKNLDIDVAIFKIKTPEGFPEYKEYPKEQIIIDRLLFSVGTIEIAFRVNRIKDSNINFDERFGAGQKLLIGSDESIFIIDCLKEGLNVWFIPEYIVNHPFESTSKKLSKYDNRKVSVTGAYDARVNGYIAIPKALFGTIKILPDLIKHQKNPLTYLRKRLLAAIYILRTNVKYR